MKQIHGKWKNKQLSCLCRRILRYSMNQPLNHNYSRTDTAVEILKQIEKGKSKRSTARFAGVSWLTTGRIPDRANLYRNQTTAIGAISESFAGE